MDHDKYDMLSCPYNKAHQISRKKYQNHILKCAYSHPHIILEKCPFNSLHLYSESDMRMHIASCPDKRILYDFKYSIQSGSGTKRKQCDPPDAQVSEGADEDDWEDEIGQRSYKPDEYACSAPIIRPNIGNLPSERKMFIEIERQRHAALNKARKKEEAAKIRTRKLTERANKSMMMEDAELERAEGANQPMTMDDPEFETETHARAESTKRQSSNRHTIPANDDISRNYNQESPINSSSQQFKKNNKCHFKVAIRHADHPVKTFRESELINFRKAILSELDDIKIEDNPKPQFLSSTISGGILSIICFNESSKNWLTNVVPTIEDSLMPNLKIIETTVSPRNYNCLIYQPPDDCLPKEILISRLITQNPAIDVSKWKYLRQVRDPDGGVEHYICVDDTSKAYLDRNHFYLFLNFSQIYVHFIDSEPKIKTECDGSARPIINLSKKSGNMQSAGENSNDHYDSTNNNRKSLHDSDFEFTY